MQLGLRDILDKPQPELSNEDLIELQIAIVNDEYDIATNIKQLEEQDIKFTNLSGLMNTIKTHGVTDEMVTLFGTEFSKVSSSLVDKNAPEAIVTIEGLLLDTGKKIIEIIHTILVKLYQFLTKLTTFHLYLTKKLSIHKNRLLGLDKPIWKSERSFVFPNNDRGEDFKTFVTDIKDKCNVILDLVAKGKWDDKNEQILSLIKTDIPKLRAFVDKKIERNTSDFTPNEFKEEFKKMQDVFKSDLNSLNLFKSKINSVRPVKIDIPASVEISPKVGVTAAATAIGLLSKHLLFKAKAYLIIAENIIETNNGPENSK